MADKPLSEIYLFSGEDTLKQKMLLERLEKRVGQMGDLAMNSHVIQAKEIQGAQHILDMLNTLPFGSPVRLVVIKDAEQLSKPVMEAITAYAKSPAPTTVLALVAKKLATNTRLYKAIQAHDPQSIVDCSAKKKSELPALIRNIARSEGVDIATSAAHLLIDRIGVSTVFLNTEVKKLAAIVKARPAEQITDADVEQNVTRLVEPKSWDLQNALALRDLSLCLRLIERMSGFTTLGLFTLCVQRLREILTAMTLKQRRVPVASAMGKQDWQIREIMRGTELFRHDELKSLLKQAPAIERGMKSGADAEQLLRMWVIEACTRKVRVQDQSTL